MPRILDLDLSPDALLDEERLLEAVRRETRDPRIAGVRLVRRSLDARKRVRFHVRLAVWREDESEPPVVRPAAFVPARLTRPGPPVVVVGAGPAGLFAALRLAEAGVPAVVLERGKPVQARRRDVAALNKRGIVDPESNYCFGEGGAGTYSDGKLYTRAEKRGSVAGVLATLVAHGAPADIEIDARPHIGSNRLPKVVSRLRATLEGAGIEVRFGARVADLVVSRGRVAAVRLGDGEEIAADAVILAAGHSARDVLTLVERAGAHLEPKPFALGVRVEHPQPLIDRIQYGADAGHPALPAAAYRLATTVEGRGVFSFCMCPGGWIVPSATSPETVVVNGMSLSRRDSPFANSGIVVAVEPRDVAALGFGGPLGGVDLQESLERAAAALGGGRQVAPAQRLRDFVAGRGSASLPATSYRPGAASAPLHELFPPPLADRLREALRRFARTMRGYDTGDAVALAVESRTSSPVRIVRDAATLESPTLAGLFPCGEGAGYAGGIVSAALDGLRVADAVAARRG